LVPPVSEVGSCEPEPGVRRDHFYDPRAEWRGGVGHGRRPTPFLSTLGNVDRGRALDLGVPAVSWAAGIDGGRLVGYGIPATCDRRGCKAVIDRGLGWRCGETRNLTETGYGCGRFYCEDHLDVVGPRGGCRHRGREAWGRPTLAHHRKKQRGVYVP
jgi:hypothetical protein